MDMSAAALPPRSGHYSHQEEQHPLFPLYRQKLNSCARLMIDAPDFADYLYQYEQQELSESAAQRPEYPDFMAWMRETKGGGRPCCPTRDMPHGLSFPANFYFWIEGGRW